MLIDAIGFATYAVPVLGEAGDAVWAPISGFLIFLLYGNIWLAGAGYTLPSSSCSYLTLTLAPIFSFLEELMPGLDFIPTATLGTPPSPLAFFALRSLTPHAHARTRTRTRRTAWVADNTGLLRAGQQFGWLRNLFSMFGGGGGNAAR